MASEPSLVSPRHERARQLARRTWHALATGERELPTYSIVGTKRAGTSSLNEYIVDHPHVIRGSAVKGCRYFDVNYHHGYRWFERQLPPKAGLDRLESRLGVRPIFGESSPYYCFHPFAMQRIAQLIPQVRLLLLTRNPIERAWSHYRYEVARGYETLSFLDALDAEEERLLDPDPLRRAFAERHYSYVARGQYGEMVNRILQNFPASSLLVIESEWMFADPRRAMRHVFHHLGLEPVDGTSYPVVKGLGSEPVPPAGARWLAGRFDGDLQTSATEPIDYLGQESQPW